jgi:cobalt-zinc-cadmium efflux system protein
LHSHHDRSASGRALVWSLAATSAFVVIELASGFRAHSLALISDAGHNATDALALLLAWFAVNPALSVITGRACWRRS